jgi:hypothetical protein
MKDLRRRKPAFTQPRELRPREALAASQFETSTTSPRQDWQASNWNDKDVGYWDLTVNLWPDSSSSNKIADAEGTSARIPVRKSSIGVLLLRLNETECVSILRLEQFVPCAESFASIAKGSTGQICSKSRILVSHCRKSRHILNFGKVQPILVTAAGLPDRQRKCRTNAAKIAPKFSSKTRHNILVEPIHSKSVGFFRCNHLAGPLFVWPLFT